MFLVKLCLISCVILNIMLYLQPDNILESVAIHLKNNFELDPEVGAVVVGFDQFISYPKMMKAASYLKNKDCIFIATNTDEQFPHEGGNIVIPGLLKKQNVISSQYIL